MANAAAGNVLPFAPGPFWTLSVEHWYNRFDGGVGGHVAAAIYAAPLLLARQGLLVLTGYTQRDQDRILGNHLFYDLAMHTTSRLAFSMAHDLGPEGVTALAISPGFPRTQA